MKPKTIVLVFLALLIAGGSLAFASPPSADTPATAVAASSAPRTTATPATCRAAQAPFLGDLEPGGVLPVGRVKQDDPPFCDPTQPNGSGTSQTCKDAYNPVCPAGSHPGSESCSVKGSCNDPATGFVGTKCDCSVWCIHDN